MINANELRIGNLFYDEDKTQCYYAGSWQRQDGWIHRDSANNTYTEMQMFPIPLTPEILEKCGFAKHLDKGSFLYFFDGVRYNTKSKVLTILRSCDKAGESQPSWCGTSIGDAIIIQYLHQLQNLYFALTGTELEIKL